MFPRNTTRYTTRYTTRNTTRYTARNTTQLLAGAAFWSFEAFKEWKENTNQLFCPDLKCCPWQHFDSVACSVAWVLRAVCMRRLPCSSFCLVLSCVQMKSEAHWGNYKKNGRWIWSPGSSWWREEICKTKNTRNPFLSSVGGRNPAPPL